MAPQTTQQQIRGTFSLTEKQKTGFITRHGLHLSTSEWFVWALIIGGGILISLFVLPLAVIVIRSIGREFLSALSTSIVGQAMWLSLTTSLVSTFIAFLIGTPLAYAQARWEFPFHSWLNTIIDLPVVLPPSVAGLALLMAFGRQGAIGQFLAEWGITLPFTTTAVLIAQTFVAAPLYIRAARAGFATIDPKMEEAALTEGASEWVIFRYIMLPLNFTSIISGIVLCWARALGEFGATLLFAGNLEGRTQTMPLAIYIGLEQDLYIALVLASILIFTSAIILRSLVSLENRRERAC